MPEPLVSVVIPAYNAAKFVGAALDSVLAQSFPDYETIVVDDGSKDTTREVVAAYGDRGVRLLAQANGGAAAARNAGMHAARGTWIAFLDADDEWTPDHLAILLERAAANPEAHMVYGNKITVDEHDVPVPSDPRFPSGWIFADLVEECLITTSTIMVRTATMRAVGGFDEDPRFKVTQDWELYLRIAALAPIAAAPETRVKYRRVASSLSRQLASCLLGNLEALRTAERLLAEGRVAAENHPERIDVAARWRRAYHETVVHLFTAGEYQAARTAGAEALRRGYGSVPIAGRALLSFLPAPVVAQIRNLARR